MRILLPGDVLLYTGRGLYGRLIQIHTWHRIGHVEVAIGHGQSVASRDGIGVNQYDLRMKDLARVLRPKVPFDLPAAMRWFEQGAKGQPYGWGDLLQFVGIPVQAPGIVCSPFATLFLRAGGVPIFNTEQAELIAPFEFELSELMTDVTEGVTT